ncbi:hypothetical protein BV25DRAFT_1913803 [Artomyces pyxidatus]|uniref:Uncharacterized protein n=1 Tax=Artomyces pyxidatus TaxID=48021 RepID=A0ACB8TA55_9AGAM|nr:hypothetical protein BV25DRAFT_1913803 [Artomyces pyxidatus]
MSNSNIPWETFKADTLRMVCRDLGANLGKRKREDVVEFVKKVESSGLEEAMAQLAAEDKEKKEEESPRRSSAKRTRPSNEAEVPVSEGRPKRGKAAAATAPPTKRGGRKAKTMESVTLTASRRSGRGAKKNGEEKEESESAKKAPTSSPERQDAEEADALGEDEEGDENVAPLPTDAAVVQTTAVEAVQVETISTA